MAFKNPFRRADMDRSTMEKENAMNAGTEPATTEGATTQQQESASADTASVEERSELETLKAELDLLRAEHQAVHDKHVRLFAEFDNFRKRTAKEKLEMLQMAGAATLKQVLPVMDDLERAIANNAHVEDVQSVKQGLELIHQKFVNLLNTQGLQMIQAKGEPFDPELHEAITKAPAPDPTLKGKVLEVVENGYMMNDKVIRYAKVVVGE